MAVQRGLRWLSFYKSNGSMLAGRSRRGGKLLTLSTLTSLLCTLSQRYAISILSFLCRETGTLQNIPSYALDPLKRYTMKWRRKLQAMEWSPYMRGHNSFIDYVLVSRAATICTMDYISYRSCCTTRPASNGVRADTVCRNWGTRTGTGWDGAGGAYVLA